MAPPGQLPSDVMRRRLVLTYLGLAGMALLMKCEPASAQAVHATISSTTLEPTSFPRWVRDLGYRKDQFYPLTVGATGCPFVEVDVSGIKLSLMLDTGTARGFVITNNAASVPHRVEKRTEELNADGTHRGESFSIRIDSMSMFGREFKNVAGTLSDWRMFSSVPFDGTIGLDFLKDRRVTLDYKALKVGVSSSSVPQKLAERRYLSLDLVQPPAMQGNILYARAKVNGRDALIYFDTGYSASFIDPAFTEGLPLLERPGKFKLYREHVPAELAGRKFVFDELREDHIDRGPGFDQPVALVLGSDVLSHFIITIDLRARKLILAVAK